MSENFEIDKFVLMPNHIHAIIIIKSEEPIEKTDKKYTFEIAERRGRRSLQGLMKSVMTRHFKKKYKENIAKKQPKGCFLC